MSRNFGGGTVMVWAAFSYYGRTLICWVSTKMNSEKYQELLENVLIDYYDQMPMEDWIFQHDNAPIHTSRYVKQWLQETNISVLDWPARSPDLNPIENLWGILARKVYENGAQYSDVNSLKTAIRNAWKEIPETILHNLIFSMKNRIFEIIKNNGGSTKY